MTTGSNKRTVLVPHVMSEVGFAELKKREDVEVVVFDNIIKQPDFIALLKSRPQVSAAILGGTRFGKAEIEASKGLQVVARIGVGFDAVEVPELTKRKIPLMTTGIANSPSVAEQAMHMMMALAKRGQHFDVMVKDGKWNDRMGLLPVDLYEKTVVVVGFGRIGTRTAKRCQAMDMNVLIYDPYVPAATIKAAGYEPVSDLDAALPRADFVSIHCPKTPETVGMFNAARLARMKPSAFLVNTARGGIIDEPALHAALTSGKLAGAGLDVYLEEPTPVSNPLLKLANVISAPHMAGVTVEATQRMALQAVRNCLSVFDGKPNKDNTVNKEIYG